MTQTPLFFKGVKQLKIIAGENDGRKLFGYCKRRLKSAAGGARKVLHLPGKEDCFFRVSSSC